MKSRLKLLSVFIATSIVSVSCFQKWILTDKELREHYAEKRSKPLFHVIENDSIKLHFVTFGADTAQPVLFIHGAPGSWDGYLNLLDDSLLQNSFHLISVDRPGYGKSQKRPKKKTYTLEEQANAIILALKSNHSNKKAIIVGRSYGAPVAAKLAAKYPDKIEKIILLSPAIDPDTEKFWWFSKFGKIFLVRWFLPERMNTATDEKYAHIKELKILKNDWKKIQSDVTVMAGGKDWIVDTTNFSFAKKMLIGKNAKFIFIPESGHLISSSRPDLVKKEIFK
ncbi:alpha/beta hydrolase fold containing protein [Emticicia oligotrophica DSM 17448]|uniref:Alpha/beta hydrolase fold containing protein n=1 Tax=Emticicia oligotrophica (strain DSM 17448 / CIP 109782 / MTCC 6937 / GPTSA100-15) TaxID=929562 RepID=A0ABN4ABJ9_EMTOG|nr:alpha/beta hydrolase [Emticicia oligotrophica]AFK01514.1 alpha/beta hydrolase fold containing protein [Emticicia oligotrophica DSM 17448]